MSALSRVPWWLRVLAVATGYAVVWVVRGALADWQVKVGVVALGYVFLVWTSGPLVDWVLDWAEAEKEQHAADDGEAAATATDGAGTGEPEDGAEPADAAERAAGTEPADGETVTQEDRDVGMIVGKAENVLLLTFILAQAYTALAVVFAAKGLVRREDIEKNTLYYLAGTMTNVTYSVAVGVAVRVVLAAFGVGDVAFLDTA